LPAARSPLFPAAHSPLFACRALASFCMPHARRCLLALALLVCRAALFVERSRLFVYCAELSSICLRSAQSVCLPHSARTIKREILFSKIMLKSPARS
jgi:hypothetical protein